MKQGMWYILAQVRSMAVVCRKSRFHSRLFVLAWFVLARLMGVLPGQAQPMPSAAVQARFASAQAAQQRKDYVTAEREYRAVLAVAPDFAEVHMNLGLLYQIQDRIAEAMTEFRRALKLNSKLAGANFFLGVDYCKRGEATQAIPYLQVAVQVEPRSADIWSWLATAQEMSGQYEREIVTLKRALDLQPKNVDLLYLLGRTYEELGKEQVASLQKLAPNSPRSEQLLAESYATSSQWPSAVLHFQNALAASPRLPGLQVELGEVFLWAEKLKPAAEEFEAELQLHPRNLRAIVRRGEAKLIGGDLDGALDDWTKALTMDQPQVERVLGMHESGFGDAALEQLPDLIRDKIEKLSADLQARNTPAAQLALAFLASQSGISSDVSGDRGEKDGSNDSNPSSRCSEGEIRQRLDQGRFSGIAPCALRILSRSSASLRLQVASAMIEAGDYDDSSKLLATLPPSDRRSPEASYWQARCYEKLATAAYLRLYRADSNSYRVHQLMGDLEATRGDDAKALEEYRAAIAIKPSLPNLHYSLGHLLWKNLKVQEARVELEAELAINPRHAGALHDLGNTYLMEHQPEQAKANLLQALVANPQNPDIHRDLGTAYSQLREYGKAEAEFKLALPGDHDGSVHYKLARVYQTLGRKDEATREFAVSTDLNRKSHDTLEKQTQRLAEIERLPQ
jgi:tetratricopeptide (TPR) repeat protein